MLIKLDIMDKDIDTEDGYILYSYEPYEIAESVKIALENGYDDIRISKADNYIKLEYDLRKAHKYD